MTYSDKDYTNFRGSIQWEFGVECESFKISSIDFFLFMRANIIYKYI